jgi:hypothetical protein
MPSQVRLMTWQAMGIAVTACSLQFFTADPYDVQGASLRRPASTVIKFDPATRQTTSSKRGYPNPMALFVRGYRCPRPWRCLQIKIQPCRLTRHLAALSAFRIIDVPIMTARNKYVRRKRVVLSFHCRKFGFNIPYRRSQSFQCVLKACRTHDCSAEHISC